MSDESDSKGFYLPPVSSTCTQTCWQFLDAYKEAIDYLYFTINLAHSADEVALKAAETLRDLEEDEVKKARFQAHIESPARAVKKLHGFREVNSKNISTTIADSFLWYISNIIQQAMKRRPEIIKSGETVKIEEIFNYPSRRELINYLIDRKINSLSYGGLKQIEKFISESLSIELFNTEEDKGLLRIFIEVRNIQTHNRGYVNRVFLDRVEDLLPSTHFKFKEGKKAYLDFDDLTLMSRVCVATAMDLDRKMAQKFGIKRKRIETWMKGARVSA